MSEDRRRERLRFQSWHRGTREMDLLMGSFADKHLADFDDQQLDAYAALLESNDLDVYNWIIGKETIPAAFDNDVTRKLVLHHFAGTQVV